MLLPETVTILSDGLWLAGHLFLPARGDEKRVPGVVICHGLASRKENHADFARVLQAHGFAVLSFDLRGHGESQGQLDQRVAADLVAAVEYLASRREVDPARLAVRGSSLGGQLAVHAAAASPRLKAVVAICPAHESLRLEWEKDPRFQERLQQLAAAIRLDLQGFRRYLQSHDVTASVTKLAPRPLLLVHCRGDEVVPYPLSEKLFQAAGDPKELWLLEGGSHGSAQHDPVLQTRIARWLASVLGHSGPPPLSVSDGSTPLPTVE